MTTTSCSTVAKDTGFPLEGDTGNYRAGAGLQPQEWWEVLSPPTELAEQAKALIREICPSGDLTTDQLEQLVNRVVAAPQLWQPLVVHDAERRRYRLLFEDDRIDLWVLAWMPGQGTGFHDHDLSGVGLAVAQGMIVERQMLLPEGATRLELRLGDSRQGGAGYIHSVGYGEGDPAVSIHAYSPPLIRVGQYKVDDHGVLERRIENGRQELMDHSIATLDPTRADG